MTLEVITLTLGFHHRVFACPGISRTWAQARKRSLETNTQGDEHRERREANGGDGRGQRVSTGMSDLLT